MHTLIALLIGVASATTPIPSADPSTCPKTLGDSQEIVVSDEDARRLYDLFLAEVNAFSPDAEAPIFYWVGRARREVDIPRMTAVLRIYEELVGETRSALQQLEDHLSDESHNPPNPDRLFEAVRTYLVRSRQRSGPR